MAESDVDGELVICS